MDFGTACITFHISGFHILFMKKGGDHSGLHLFHLHFRFADTISFLLIFFRLLGLLRFIRISLNLSLNLCTLS